MSGQKTDEQIAQEMLDWFAEPGHWVEGYTAQVVRSRDDFGETDVQATCLIGAYSHVALGGPYALTFEKSRSSTLLRLLREVIAEQYPDRARSFSSAISIPYFNDHPHTTIHDIRRVLEKVRALAAEGRGDDG